jgi:hypothetical protein
MLVKKDILVMNRQGIIDDILFGVNDEVMFAFYLFLKLSTLDLNIWSLKLSKLFMV